MSPSKRLPPTTDHILASSTAQCGHTIELSFVFVIWSSI